MKNTMIAFALVVLFSGCSGSLMARGNVNTGAYGYGYGNQMNASYGASPMIGAYSTLPIGARGRVVPYGGSVYYGTGYTNPEVVMSAEATRSTWRGVPLTGATQQVASSTELTRRLEAVEDQLLTEHMP